MRIKKKNHNCLLCNQPCYGTKYCADCYTHKAQLGRTPWNKGIHTGIIPKTAFKKGVRFNPLGEFKKGVRYSQNTEFKKGNIPHNYKGDNVGYNALHTWLYRQIGKATSCTKCGSTTNVQWANKSFEYKRELSDWTELCYKCHRRYDMENGWGRARRRFPELRSKTL